jgi:hypothetical protein
MAETAKLNAKLKAYLEDPKDFLDLSGMGFRADGARIVAKFLPKWWVWGWGVLCGSEGRKTLKDGL